MSNVKTQIEDARAAYHRLMTGTAVKVVVDQNGERVEYNTANAAKLLAYLTSLCTPLSLDPLTGRSTTQTSAPMRVFF
jgi:hypothetical protein